MFNKNLSVIFLFFLLITASLFSNYQLKAEAVNYNFDSYLENTLNQSRELREAEINLSKKKIDLEKEEAEQEIKPSPLLLKKAELELEIAAKNLEIRKDEITKNLISDYFNYYKAKNLVQVHQKYKEILEEELENIEDKYQQGLLTKSDLMQAEVELKRAEKNLVNAKNNKKASDFKIKQNLNLNYKKDLELKFEEEKFNNWTLAENLDQLFAAALSNRIEIEEAEVNKSLQEINYKIAAADYSPNLTEKEAEIDLINARNKSELIKDQIQLDVNNKYLTYQDSKENLKHYQKMIESFTEALRIKRLYFDEDYITGTELLETQVDLYQTEVNYSHAQIDYYLSLAELYLSTGDFKEMLIYENE